MAVDLFDNWFDPIEAEVGARSREFIEELLRGGAGALEVVLTATILIRFCVATDAIDAAWAGAGLVFNFFAFRRLWSCLRTHCIP